MIIDYQTYLNGGSQYYGVGRILNWTSESAEIVRKAIGVAVNLYSRAIEAAVRGAQRITEVEGPTANLISWWKLNQNGNDAHGSNHGTVYGATALRFGCYSFDGDNDYIDCGYDSAMNVANVTLEAWVRPSAVADGVYCIMGRRSAGVHPYTLNYQIASSGSYRRIGFTCGAFTYWGTVNLTVDDWNHVVATYNGSNLILYVNGVEDRKEIETGSLPTGTAKFLIADAWGYQRCKGSIDEPRLYDAALSPANVLNRFNWTRWRQYISRSVALHDRAIAVEAKTA